MKNDSTFTRLGIIENWRKKVAEDEGFFRRPKVDRFPQEYNLS